MFFLKLVSQKQLEKPVGKNSWKFLAGEGSVEKCSWNTQMEFQLNFTARELAPRNPTGFFQLGNVDISHKWKEGGNTAEIIDIKINNFRFLLSSTESNKIRKHK